MRAFDALSLGRQIGMTMSPISLGDIVLYWERVSRIGELQEFLGVIRALDVAFLKASRDSSSG